MEMTEEHYIFLQLLHWMKQFQIAALGLNTALSTILQLPPDDKKKITKATMDDLVAKAKETAKQQVDSQTHESETALKAGSDFLPALRKLLESRQ